MKGNLVSEGPGQHTEPHLRRGLSRYNGSVKGRGTRNLNQDRLCKRAAGELSLVSSLVPGLMRKNCKEALFKGRDNNHRDGASRIAVSNS